MPCDAPPPRARTASIFCAVPSPINTRGVHATGSFCRFRSCISSAMSHWPPDWLDEYPAAVRETLGAALSGGLDPPIVLTRLFLALADIGKISALLSRAEVERRTAGDHDSAQRLRA